MSFSGRVEIQNSSSHPRGEKTGVLLGQPQGEKKKGVVLAFPKLKKKEVIFVIFWKSAREEGGSTGLLYQGPPV